MGWTGTASEVQMALAMVNADTTPDGRQFIMIGEPPVSFMGAGDELVVNDDVHYMKNKQPQNLVWLMNQLGLGMRVTVI